MAAPRSTGKIQIGLESSAGTAVAATRILRCKAARVNDLREVVQVPEDIGILVPTNRTYIPKLGAELTFPESDATFEDLPYHLACGIKNTTSGVADGSGTGKIYAYPFPTASTKNTIKTATLETGDSQDAERMEYGVVSEFKLSGQRDQAVMLSAKWIGRQAAVNAFTGALSAPTVETILFNKSKLYIDDTGGTLGSTQKSSTLVAFTLNVVTGQKPIPTGGDGNLYFPSVDIADPKVTLDVTFIYDSNATTAKTKWRAETAALVRLSFDGTAITKGSGAYDYKTLLIDVAGKWDRFEPTAERDGFYVVTGKLTAGLDSTASLFAALTVVNLNASL